MIDICDTFTNQKEALDILSNDKVKALSLSGVTGNRIKSYLKKEVRFSDDVKSIVLPNEKGVYESIYAFGKIENGYLDVEVGSKGAKCYWAYDDKIIGSIADSRIYKSYYDNSTKNIKGGIRTDKVKLILKGILNRLQHLKSLPEQWDSYNAKKIEWFSFCNAIVLFFEAFTLCNKIDIPFPFIGPVANGGIKVEWDTLAKKLHFIIPPKDGDKWEYSKEDLLNMDIPKEYGIANGRSPLVEIIVKWFFDEQISY